MKKDEPEKKKVFFITSNQTKLDKIIEYKIKNNIGLINLKAGYNNSEFKKEIKYKNYTFSVYINSFEIDCKNLKKDYQDPSTKKYNSIITLRYNKTNFPGYISFNALKNNFIYDFKFNECKSWGKIYDPPLQINFSHLEQLKIYDEYLDKVLKKEKNEQIYYDLVADSQSISFSKKIDLDYFLEIFKICYTEKIVKLFLKSFKLENIIFPINFIYKDYEPMLKLIENDFNIIIRHCSEKEDKFVYYNIFYTLLLFVRYNYEKDKTVEMLNNKNLWPYFIKILPDKYKFFPKLNVPNGLIEKMFEQDLDYQLIIKILSLCCSVEQILFIINSKIETISNCCLKENQLIMIFSLVNLRKEDNLEKIIEEIKKIIKYEYDNNKIFISFDTEFLNNYNDLKKLYLAKEIILYTNPNKDSVKDNSILDEKIHKIGLESIKAGILKNEDILLFIKNDIFFSDNRFANEINRPLDIIDGLDFDTMTSDFYSQWNKSNIFDIFSFEGFEFKYKIVNKINDMKYFRKMLDLFDYKNKNIFDMSLFRMLTEKFKNLLHDNKYEIGSFFIEDVAYFIYILDFQNKYDIEKFLSDTIEEYISPSKIVVDIYISLLTKYKGISLKLMEDIIHFLIENNKLINAREIFILLEKINLLNIFESLIELIEYFDTTNLKDKKEKNMIKKEDEDNLKLLNFKNEKIEINIFLKKNYKDIIEKEITDKEISMLEFSMNNIEYLRIKYIILLLEKANSQNAFEYLINKLKNLIIKEDELFNQEKKTKSFQLLEAIIEHKLFEKYNFEDLKKNEYFLCSLKNKENVLNKIKNGEIKYSFIKNIDSNSEKNKIFEDKLIILLFNNKKKTEECMEILYEKYIYITENLLNLKKLFLKFKKVDKYENEIAKIKNLINTIDSGMINEIDKPEVKNEIDEIDKTFNKIDSEKMNIYKKSRFFIQIYEMKRMDNIIPKKESEYFEQAENDFNKLKLLFENEKWYEVISEQLLIDCFKCIKNKKRDNLRNELITLIKIFQIKEFDDLKIHSLLFGLLSFCQKEEILSVSKNLYNIIIELEAVSTDLFKEFTQTRNDLLIKFDYDKIILLGKILEYYGFDLLDPDENDRDYIDILLNNFAEGSFKFIADINDNDMKKFEELISKSEDKSITNNDIQEMFKCSNFIHGLGVIKGTKNDKDLIKEFINEVQRTKNIKESFKNYAKCSEKILKLYNKK